MATEENREGKFVSVDCVAKQLHQGGYKKRLRVVTGYPGSFDATADHDVPDNDGIFKIDVASGERRLACSFRQIFDHLVAHDAVPAGAEAQMFINHTLWNRQDDRILPFARSSAGWGAGGGAQINTTFTMRPDGSGLTYHGYVGGHPEWDEQSRIITAGTDGLRVYDPQQRGYVDTIGSSAAFSDPKGDKTLSADSRLLVHGNAVRTGQGHFHQYVVYRMADGHHDTSPLCARGTYIEGDLRLDAAPCWNRSGNQFVVPAIAADGTRQMFVLSLHNP